MNTKNQVSYISFAVLERYPFIKHGFSTRLGGVSKGIYNSMNLSFTRGDKKEDVLENFQRMAAALDIKAEDLVFSDQIHKTDIHIVTKEDKGKGIVRESDIKGMDGLITNVLNLPLVTFYADCVPLYFVDPINKAIGLAHSGWRGTVSKIGKKIIEKMNYHYNTDPCNVIAVIAPSICKECFEIKEDVAQEFKKAFSDKIINEVLTSISEDKYQLDLWQTNKYILMEAGLSEENIHVTDICTRCNTDIFYSHRALGADRGGLAAFLSLT